MQKIFFFILVLLTLAGNGFSQEAALKDSKTESWYTYWGLGYASISYPSELQKGVDNLADQSGVSHTSVGFDILGFYWPVAKSTIAGVIVNGVGDRFEKDGNSIQLNQYTYSASAIHYLGSSFGSGLFLRGDLGIAKLAVTSEGNGVSITAASQSGFGVLLGGGYSFDFGGTRLLLNLDFTYRSVESETYNTVLLSVGGLF